MIARKFVAVLCFISSTQLVKASDNDLTLVKRSTARFQSMISSGQYMAKSCSPIKLESWPNIPILRCAYSSLQTSAEVSLILPDAARLARWTVTACRDAGSTEMENCIASLERRIRRASGGQFAVRGFVIEPRSVLGGSSQEPLCFLFRDGVTVRTDSVTTRPPQNGKCAPQSADNDPITRAFSFARVASTTRAEFARAPGAPTELQLAGIAFPNAVRAELISAWNSPRNRLISGAAISDKAIGKFN
jgi:hypothetical protein